MRHVIIGNGVAGVSAAEAIRRLDPHSSLTIIAREPHHPYCRPMISLVLAGEAQFGNLPIRPANFYGKLSAELISGRKAVGLDLDNRLVRLDRGGEVPFDRLLIASGADPRPVKARNADLAGVFHLRTQDDVAGILQMLPGAQRALVLGGGLVGFKAAHGLMRRGLKVTMLIRSGYPLSMQLDPEAGALILEELIANGLQVRVGEEAVAFEGRSGRVKRAVLSGGDTLDCDLVVAGKGVLPAKGFIPEGRIKTDLGILVDGHLMTSVPGVYAAGDVAEHFDLARGERWVNALWPVAVEQGLAAGANMAGRPVAYRGSLSRNVMRVYGRTVLTGGLVNPPADRPHQVYARHNPARRTFRRLVFDGDRLLGLAMVGEVEQGGMLLNALARGIPIPGDKERLLEPGLNYASIWKK